MATSGEKPGKFSRMAPTPPQRDLPGHWNAMQQALVTYRHSVDLYRQVLASRARLRPVHANGHSHDMAFSRVRDVGVSIPGARSSLDGLTPRELEVAQLMAQGHTNQQIADILVVTRGTAANHVAHILDRKSVV